MARFLDVDDLLAHSYITPDGNEGAYLDHLLRAAEDSAEMFLQRCLCEYVRDGELPSAIKHAILMRAADLYENRENIGPAQVRAIPMSYYELLAPYRDVGQYGSYRSYRS